MGQSTDGQLSFGVVFEEGFEFPWDEYGGNIEGWWKKVRGYDNPHYCPFTDDGEYKDDAPIHVDQYGMKLLKHDDPRVVSYYEYSREWNKNNPFPIAVVNYCSGDCPMYILAVKHVYCSRGYPEAIKPSFLIVDDEDRAMLAEFLEAYNIEADGEPQWWLTSYWG